MLTESYSIGILERRAGFRLFSTKVLWYRDVAIGTIGERAYSFDVPPAIAWAEDHELGLAIAIVISRHWYITIGAILGSAYSLDVPIAITWTEDCNFSLAIAIVISRNGDIVILTIDKGADAVDVPSAITRTKDGRIGQPGRMVRV